MKKKRKPILIFIILLVGLYVIIYAFPKVTKSLVPTYTAEYGELQVKDQVTGFFVRNEQVYLTEKGGESNRYIKEGSLIRKGTTVLEITGSSDDEMSDDLQDITDRLGSAAEDTNDYKSTEGGIISYYVDGNEDKLTPKNMKKISFDKLENMIDTESVKVSDGDVASGQPVFKVVDRTSYYIAAFVENSHGKRYSKGQQVVLHMNEKTSIYGKVIYKHKEGDHTRLIIETDDYYKSFAKVRSKQIDIVTSIKSGVIIYNSSIGEKNGVKGVYVKTKAGQYKFMPIKILATDDEHSVVADSFFYDDKGQGKYTIDVYDDVLKNAK